MAQSDDFAAHSKENTESAQRQTEESTEQLEQSSIRESHEMGDAGVIENHQLAEESRELSDQLSDNSERMGNLSAEGEVLSNKVSNLNRKNRPEIIERVRQNVIDRNHKIQDQGLRRSRQFAEEQLEKSVESAKKI
ncbi:MAG: hypothetical protein ACREN8_03260 [Candidatus Dormibacteraceae bacterium]